MPDSRGTSRSGHASGRGGHASGRGGGYFSRLGANLRRNLSERPGSTLLILIPAVLILAFFVYVAAQVFLAPSVDDLADRKLAGATVLYTSGGKELSRLYEENRTAVPLDSMAETLPEALIAIEDQRFPTHGGVSFRRTAGALFQTAKGNKQGGSTITMQLARNAFTDVANDWIITRKIKEWITAVRINDQYSKDQVLDIYLNTVPFNYNSFGVEAASQVYFNKPASQIDTLQSATLMAMLRGPTYYNPVQNPENNRRRRNDVLDAMTQTGALTTAQAERLKKQDTEMDFQPVSVNHNMAPYFAEYVRNKLKKWAKDNDYDIYRDGLKVYTTLDAGMQKAAKNAVDEEMDDLQAVVDVSWSSASSPYFSSSESAYQRHRNPDTAFDYFWETHPDLLDSFVKRSARYKRLTGQGTGEEEALDQLKGDSAFIDSVETNNQRLQTGLVALRPSDGHIKAWVGGRNFEEDQFDHVYLAQRQPGSTFKPFVYATALNRGYRQNDVLRDAQIEYVNSSGDTWSPGNFGGESGKMVTVKHGLAHSLNTITAQLIIDIGPGRVAQTAHRMGIKSELQAVPSLGLGTSDVKLLEMVSAYTTFPNNGRSQEPLAITRIENRYGRTIANFQSDSREGLPASVAYGTLQMMEAVVTEGTGVRIKGFIGGGDWAAKTGTTQGNADGWFMLVHPKLVTGAWVGFDSRQIQFRTSYWGQGAHNALKVVGHFMQDVGLEPASFQAPPGYEPPAEGKPKQRPKTLFADQDNVSFKADSISSSAVAAKDSFTLGDLGPDAGSDTTGADTAVRSDTTAGAEGEATAEAGEGEEAAPQEQQREADGTENIEGQSEADDLNQQQSIEVEGDGN